MPSKKMGQCANPECDKPGETTWVKGRGLCRRCYNLKFRQGTLDQFKPEKAKALMQASPTKAARKRTCVCPPEQIETDGCVYVADQVPTVEVVVQGLELTHDEGANMAEQKAVETPSVQRKKTGKAGVDFSVTIDFGPAAHLLEEIRRRADEQMRPLPMQILWELKQASAGAAA